MILSLLAPLRVVAFEPVPRFRAFLEYNLHLNGFVSLVQVSANAVSHTADKDVEMVFPSRGVWGTAGIGGLNIDKAITGSESIMSRVIIIYMKLLKRYNAGENVKILVPSVRLEDVIKEDVLLLKVDVEGWEWSVLNGSSGLIRGSKVENVVMEYSPGEEIDESGARMPLDPNPIDV